jgi:hypothetical protein
MTLEAMSEKFDKPVLDYAKEKIENAFGLKFTAKSKPEPTTQDDRNSSGNDDEVQCEVQHEEMSGRKESGEEEAK